MPEGDAVRRLARTFEDLFEGRRCAVSSPQGRFAASAARIDGWRMQSVRAVGKHLFLGFVPATADGGAPVAGDGFVPATDEGVPAADEGAPEWVHVHLGLYGSWRFSGDATFEAPPSIGAPRTPLVAVTPGPRGAAGPGRDPEGPHRAQRWSPLRPGTGGGADPDDGVWEPPEPVGQVRVRIATDHGAADLSGPTRCELISDAQRQAVEAGLGPDPLAPHAREDPAARMRFVTAVRARRRAVGELVMDQSVAAGIGNIYRAESLFLAGISPHRRGANVSASRLRRLWGVVCDLMSRGLSEGRIVTVDPADAPSPPLPGDPEASRWYVYHRTGRPCLRCGTPVREQVMQGRRLFWCPSCQR